MNRRVYTLYGGQLYLKHATGGTYMYVIRNQNQCPIHVSSEQSCVWLTSSGSPVHSKYRELNNYCAI